MKKILISCDSTCALPRDEAKKIGLPILPLNVIVDGVEYHDGIDIDPDQLNQMMRGGKSIKTSTPTPVEIDNFFDQIFKEEDPDVIIHFTISSKLSSMFNLFTNHCKERYGDKVVVVDSLSVCVYMLNHVLTAKKLAEEGKSVEEILCGFITRFIGKVASAFDVVYMIDADLPASKGGEKCFRIRLYTAGKLHVGLPGCQPDFTEQNIGHNMAFISGRYGNGPGFQRGCRTTEGERKSSVFSGIDFITGKHTSGIILQNGTHGNTGISMPMDSQGCVLLKKGTGRKYTGQFQHGDTPCGWDEYFFNSIPYSEENDKSALA